VPFALLLILIAAMPLSPAPIKHFWEHYYAHTAIALGLAVAGYFVLRLPDGTTPCCIRPGSISPSSALSFAVLSLREHPSQGQGEATPLDNVVCLAVGAVMTNFIGTTGASMVLIRPFIRMNKIRVSAITSSSLSSLSPTAGFAHPIGDPPLFLGYLRGIPFFWLVDQVFGQWLATVGAILATFYLIDRRAYHGCPGRCKPD